MSCHSSQLPRTKNFGVVGANIHVERALKCSAIVLWATRVRELARKTFPISTPLSLPVYLPQ